MLLHHHLLEASGTHGGRVALIGAGERVSYGDLADRAERIARALQDAGVERGDRVATMIDNSVEAVASAWGILRAGGVLVALGPAVRARRLRYVIDDAEPRVIIAAPETAGVIAEAFAGLSSPPKVVWTVPPKGREGEASLAGAPSGRARETGQIDQDLAAIIYTSGTTGDSKGVMLTHRNLVNTMGVISRYLGNTRDDVVCCVLPMWFSYGLCQVFAAPMSGCSVLIEKSFAFPYEVLKRVQDHRATGLPGVPTLFAKLLKMMPVEGIDLSSLRYFTNAAAGIPPAHVTGMVEAFPRAKFYAMYGQTECTRGTYLDPALARSRPESVGRAIENSEAWVVREDGSRADPGEAGELVIRGANVMRGYWRKPEATAAKLRDGPIPGEKVLFTGDHFVMDREGLLTFVARADDVFKCRGEKVAPSAIENVLYELPDVAEAAVVGVEDANDGLAVKAFVVPREGATLTEAMIRKHCAGRLDPVMVPRFVELVASLPKTESGKLRRAGLKAGA